MRTNCILNINVEFMKYIRIEYSFLFHGEILNFCVHIRVTFVITNCNSFNQKLDLLDSITSPVFLLRGYATGSSILPFHLPPSFAHSISGFHASLSQLLSSLFFFHLSLLFSSYRLSFLSLCLSLFTPWFPESLYDGHFSLHDRNSATLYIQHTHVDTHTCKHTKGAESIDT